MLPVKINVPVVEQYHLTATVPYIIITQLSDAS